MVDVVRIAANETGPAEALVIAASTAEKVDCREVVRGFGLVWSRLFPEGRFGAVRVGPGPERAGPVKGWRSLCFVAWDGSSSCFCRFGRSFSAGVCLHWLRQGLNSQVIFVVTACGCARAWAQRRSTRQPALRRECG